MIDITTAASQPRKDQEGRTNSQDNPTGLHILESKPGSGRRGWVEITFMDPGTKGFLEDRHVATGAQPSQWCQHLEVRKDVGDLPTELVSPFLFHPFFFCKFYKCLPCLKRDTEKLPLRRKGERWKSMGIPTVHSLLKKNGRG